MRFLTSTLLLAALAAGCFTLPPMVVHRRSTAEASAFARTRSTVRVALSRTAAQEALQRMFRERGADLEDRRDAPNGDVVYFFYGDRQRYTRVVAGGGSAFAESLLIGSWYGVRIHDAGDGVDVQIVGKPTLNRNPFCSAADTWFADVNYECADNRLREGAAAFALVSGNEEYAVVNAVFIQLRELAERAAATTPAPAAQIPVEAAPPAAPATTSGPRRPGRRGPPPRTSGGGPTI